MITFLQRHPSHRLASRGPRRGSSPHGLMGGTVILEQIFAIPGLGSFFISAIRFRDYPIVQGTVIVFAVIFMLVNLLIDLMYGWLDPRISYS